MNFDPLPVYFSSANPIPPSIPSIVVTPLNPGWNDFSFHFRVQISVYMNNEDEAYWSAPGFVVPLEDWQPQKRISSWIASLALPTDPLSKVRNVDHVSGGSPRYISLLGSESAYSSLAQSFAEPNARHTILAALNDVLLLQHAGTFSQQKIVDVINSKNFSLGVLRDSSAFRAFHRGHRFLFIPVREYIDEASRNFGICCVLGQDEKQSAVNLRFNFNVSTILQDRVQCLIGVNGTGKSRLLREIVFEAAAKIVPDIQSVFRENVQSSASFVESDLPKFNRVIVFSSDTEDRFPRAARADSSFEYLYFNLIESKHEKSNRSLVKNLIGIIREGQEIEGMSRLSIAKRALKGYIDFDNIFIPLLEEYRFEVSDGFVDHNGEYWIRAVSLTARGEQKMLELTSKVDTSRDIVIQSGGEWDTPISSGQRVYLRFILQLLGSIDTGTLVIMDEPENHLHPNLICDLMTLLYQALSSTQSIAVIATHSAYVVREVPTHCVHVLTVGADSRVQVTGVYLKTLGASISQISQAVFGDATAKKYHQLLARRLAESGDDLEQIISDHAADLNPEMLSIIRSEISRSAEGNGTQRKS